VFEVAVRVYRWNARNVYRKSTDWPAALMHRLVSVSDSSKQGTITSNILLRIQLGIACFLGEQVVQVPPPLLQGRN